MTRFVWITDPWTTLDHPNDSSLRLIEECITQKIPTYWADVKSIRLESGGRVLLQASLVLSVAKPRHSNSFKLARAQTFSPAEFQRLLYRTDPPVDLAYLHPLQLLSLGTRNHPKSEIINSADFLFASNEKLEPEALGPKSIISSQWEFLKRFGVQQKQTVLKPLHEAQSKGVELLEWTPKHFKKNHKLLNSMTENFQRPVILQEYLKQIHGGEVRLWFLNGHLLATARKIPKKGEFKINMDAGATLALTELTTAQKKVAKQLSLRLRKHRIRLAAVDLIENLVTDFNFTSPGLVVQMEALLKQDLAKPIVSSLKRPWT